MVMTKEQRTGAWVSSLNREINNLRDQLRDANKILADNNQLINYFKDSKGMSIEEIDSCIEQHQAYDKYVDTHIVKKGIGVLTLNT